MAKSNEQQSVQDNPEAHPPSSPQTDPTNPYRPESTGENVPAERSSERRERGPGLTDRERQGATGGR
jgi:hypothetical protein